MKQLFLLTTLFSALVATAHAEDDTDTLFKNSAIAGALLSWGAASLWGEEVLNSALHAGKHMYFGVYQAAEKQTNAAGLIYGWDFKHPLIQRNSWHMQAQWEVDLQGWWADNTRRKNTSGWFLGITPVIQYVYHGRYQPYAEFGIGLKYLSDIQVGDAYKSTQFQFGNLIGMGVQIENIQIGFRFLHISNAGIETPNPGTNYYGIKVNYAF